MVMSAKQTVNAPIRPQADILPSASEVSCAAIAVPERPRVDVGYQPGSEHLLRWIKQAELRSEDFLFPSRMHGSPHLGTRQYARSP